MLSAIKDNTPDIIIASQRKNEVKDFFMAYVESHKI